MYIMVNQINKFRYGGVREERRFAFLLDAQTCETYVHPKVKTNVPMPKSEIE